MQSLLVFSNNMATLHCHGTAWLLAGSSPLFASSLLVSLYIATNLKGRGESVTTDSLVCNLFKEREVCITSIKRSASPGKGYRSLPQASFTLPLNHCPSPHRPNPHRCLHPPFLPSRICPKSKKINFDSLAGLETAISIYV